jgi:hypothetical protein
LLTALPVDHGIEREGRAKAVGVADHPRGEHAPAGPAGDEQVPLVDVALRDHRVHPGVQVVKVVARVRMVDQVPELLAVARAAARIGVQHHEAGRGHQLLLLVEPVAVVRERAPVDLEDQGILPARVEARGLDDPAMDPPPVLGRRVPDLLDLPDRAVGEQAGVEGGEHTRRGGGAARHHDLAWHRRRAQGIGDHPGARDRVAAAAVGARATPEAGCHDGVRPVEREAHDLGVPALIDLAVDRRAVRAPRRGGDAVVEPG